MDFLKAFHTINHDILIAKLGEYGFDAESLKLSKSYTINHLQKMKVNTSSISRSTFFQGCLKKLHCDQLDLIFILTIYFILQRWLMYVIMLTIKLFILVTWTLSTLLLTGAWCGPCYGIVWIKLCEAKSR